MFFNKRKETYLSEFFTKKEIPFLEKYCKIKTFKKWDRILKKWDECDWMFLILSWDLFLFKWNGKTGFLTDWSFFWELSLIMSKPLNWDAIVSSDKLSGLFIPKDLYLKIKTSSKKLPSFKPLVRSKYWLNCSGF